MRWGDLVLFGQFRIRFVELGYAGIGIQFDREGHGWVQHNPVLLCAGDHDAPFDNAQSLAKRLGQCHRTPGADLYGCYHNSKIRFHRITVKSLRWKHGDEKYTWNDLVGDSRGDVCGVGLCASAVTPGVARRRLRGVVDCAAGACTDFAR